MNHNSANLAFGRREKNIWGYKKVQGGKKPIRKSEKKVATFFFFFLFFFGDSKKFVGGGKNEQGAPNGNVTPLAPIPTKDFDPSPIKVCSGLLSLQKIQAASFRGQESN